MIKPKLCWLYATTTLLLGGCSSNISLPWETNFLDPSRVATREPLEIPPDLNTLPPAETAKDPGSTAKVPWTDPALAQKNGGKADGKTAGNSNQTIHLPSQLPGNSDDASASRNEQEKLPSWMGK
ncbi:MAG: hypothetical protein HQL87_03815 [Magnetococcales bacterium]|nr:hypothetical protein [Magnetococcales bacterium]